MILSQLSAEQIDNIKMAAFIAACLFNRQALLIVSFHAIGSLLFKFTSSDPVIYFCLEASMYSTSAAVNIRLKSEIRHVLIIVGCLNWLAAVDFIIAPDRVTLFYTCYPWLINCMDILIIYHLLNAKGLKLVRTTRPWFCRLVNL